MKNNKTMHSLIQQAALILKNGGIVAFPTETVYGLGADATNKDAIKRVYQIKGRPENHPLIVHIASFKDLDRWAVDVPWYTSILAEAFWPGPMTLILKKSSLADESVTGGQDTVGLRVPSNPIAQKLLHEFGGGIAAPSANRFGRISPTTAAHVQADLGSLVDLIIDGGMCQRGIESTIIDLTTDVPKVLRPGALQFSQISKVLTDIGIVPQLSSANAVNQKRVSGSLPGHYAPRTPLLLVDSCNLLTRIDQMLAQNLSVFVLSFQQPSPAYQNISWIVMPSLEIDYAHELYARLHQADQQKPSYIIVEKPPMTSEWIAIHDRLSRAERGSSSAL